MPVAGLPVAGLPVRLRIVAAGHVIRTIWAHTGARGRFSMSVPPAPAHADEIVDTTYRGVSYSATLGNTSGATPVVLPVYRTTSSDARIAAMSVLIGVRRQGRNLAVIEQWHFANLPTTTAAGPGGETFRGTVRFPLPSGAVNARVVGTQPAGVSAFVRGSSVEMATTLRPATGPSAANFDEIQFTYEQPGTAAHPTLSIPTRYFIGSLDVFTVGSRLIAPGFTRTVLSTGHGSVPALHAQAIAPGSTLVVGVGGPPAVAVSAPAVASLETAPDTFPTRQVAVLLELGFGGLVVVGVLGGGLAASRARSHRLRHERDRLVARIAGLDLAYRRGTVDEGTYQRKRADEKRRLVALARQLGE